jgi:hypothetical protein
VANTHWLNHPSNGGRLANIDSPPAGYGQETGARGKAPPTIIKGEDRSKGKLNAGCGL